MMPVSVLQQFRSVHVSLKLTSNPIFLKTLSAVSCTDRVLLVAQGLGLILWCFGWMSEITLYAKPGIDISKPSHPVLFFSYFLSQLKKICSQRNWTCPRQRWKIYIKMIISLGPKTAHRPTHKSYTHSKINKLLWWESICSYWSTICWNFGTGDIWTVVCIYTYINEGEYLKSQAINQWRVQVIYLSNIQHLCLGNTSREIHLGCPLRVNLTALRVKEIKKGVKVLYPQSHSFALAYSCSNSKLSKLFCQNLQNPIHSTDISNFMYEKLSLVHFRLFFFLIFI